MGGQVLLVVPLRGETSFNRRRQTEDPRDVTLWGDRWIVTTPGHQWCDPRPDQGGYGPKRKVKGGEDHK